MTLLQSTFGAVLSVDASSTFEIGTAGGATAGTLTVDAGVTLTQSPASYAEIDGNVRIDGLLQAQNFSLGGYFNFNSYNDGTLSGSGIVEVAAGGWLTINDFIAAGSLTLQVNDGGYLALAQVAADAVSVTLASNATLNVMGSVGGGGTIALNGSSDVVIIPTSYGTTFAATISGFDNSQAEIVLSSAGNAGTVSLGTAGHSFVWAGPFSGAWQTAANWDDTTAGTSPAVIAPGSNDSVTFNSPSAQFQSPYTFATLDQFITGTGDAGALTFNGNNVVTGALTAGTLTSAGSLEVFGGGLLSAGNATVAAVDVESATLAVAGTLTVTGAGTQIGARNGGTIQVGALTIASSGASVWVGGTSRVVVGAAAAAAAGMLTVAAGATLSQTGTVGTYYNSSELDGTIAVDGLITAQALNLGNRDYGYIVSGSGTVEVAASGSVWIYDTVTAGSLSLQVDAGGFLSLAQVAADAASELLAAIATLDVSGSVGGGNTVTLGGGNDVVQIGTGFAATLAGLDTSDILLVGAPMTGVQYSAGALTLLNGAATVETLAITGNFAGDSFVVHQVSSAEAEIALSDPASAGTVSAGTSGHSFVWAGGLSGAWQSAASWNDTTTNQNPAVIAPGSNDSVTFNSPSYLSQIVSGSGVAAVLTFNGDNLVVGALSAGTLTSAGSLEVAAGRLSAGSATLAIVAATQGGAIQIGTLTLAAAFGADVTVDTTATFEVGTAGGAAAGTLTVDAGATLSQYGSASRAIIHGNVRVDGLLDAQSLVLGDTVGGNTLSGSGTVAVATAGSVWINDSIAAAGLTLLVRDGGALSLEQVAAGTAAVTLASSATLNAYGSVGSGDTVTLSGSNDLVEIGGLFVPGAAIAFAGTISGFGSSDILKVNGAVVTGVSYAAGTLTLLDGTTSAGTIAIAGDYTGQTFHAVTTLSDPWDQQTQIYLTPTAVTGRAGVLTVVPLGGTDVSLGSLLAIPALLDNGRIDRLYVYGQGTLQAGGFATLHTLDIGGNIGSGGRVALLGGVATADAVTINASGTLSGYGTLGGGGAVNGHVIASGGTLDMLGNITGTGTLSAVSGGTLLLQGTVAAGVSVVLDGAGAALLLGPLADLAASVSVLAPGSAIGLEGGSVAATSYDAGTRMLTITSALGTSFQVIVAGSYQPGNFIVAGGSVDLPCFVSGTRILTQTGETRVENLRPGDMVATAAGALRPVRWIGHRTVTCRQHPRPWDIWPVRVRAGAFGRGQPRRDLLLSPDHAVYIDGVLIPIRYLVNGRTVAQEQVARLTYWHVELDAHDAILADGLPCESFLDTGNRAAFANGGAAVQMQPDFALRVWQAKACAPLVVAGPEREAARSWLLARAEELGHALTRDPDVRVVTDGRVIRPTIIGRTHYCQLPPGVSDIRLVSRACVPAHTRPEDDDARSLGVAVSRMCLDGRAIGLESRVLSAGWHAPESGWRWTTGNASLRLDNARELAFDVAITGTYWADASRGDVRAA